MLIIVFVVSRAWLQTCIIIALIIGAPIATALSLHLLTMDFTKITAIGGLILFEYICFRYSMPFIFINLGLAAPNFLEENGILLKKQWKCVMCLPKQ